MRRTIKLLLAAVAILAALCSGAWAKGPTYISDDHNDPGPTWTTENSPYIVDRDALISYRITVSGDVTLILTDGYTLTAVEGINVSGDSTVTNSLTIEGGPLGTGRLRSRTEGEAGRAAIGGSDTESCGTITINGGMINADSSNGGAGIGGGDHASGGGTIVINGGMITATVDGSGAAAIGGGHSGQCGTITINDGVVDAYSLGGAGIGGGMNGSGDTAITITGGKVTATSANAAAIGGGGVEVPPGLYNGTIVIEGGEVTAVSLAVGAGIGGGRGEAGGTITIAGGKVVASANDGAGIGGGHGESGGTITITGGTVEASSVRGAGIGGGDPKGAGGDIKILGGVVNAKSAIGKGIGGGEGATDHGTLSSGENGGAWIDTSSVGARTQDFISGVLFDGDDGKVCGSVSMSGDVAIASGRTLAIPSDATLTIKQGAKLTVEQDATISNSGKFINDGELWLPASMTQEQIKALKITGTGRIYWGGKLIHPDGETSYDGAIAESSKKFADASRAWTPDYGDWEIAVIIEDDGVDVAAVSIDGEPLDGLDWSIRAAGSGELSAKAASVRTVVISAETLSSLADETTPTSHDLRITMTDGGYAEMTFWVGTEKASAGSSSGSCAAGFGIAAIVALAVIKRRSR